MKTAKKSQSWSIDFTIGLLIFLLAITLSVKFINQSDNSDFFRDLYDESTFISEQLRSEGYPPNWTKESLVRVGLLSEGKLNLTKFSNFTALTYPVSKNYIHTQFEYFMLFEDEYGHMLNISGHCGFGSNDMSLSANPNKAAYYYNAEDFMMAVMANDFSADVYSSSTNNLDNLLNPQKLSEYNFIFMENPNLGYYSSLDESTIVSLLQNWTRKGNTLFLTQNVNLSLQFLNANFSDKILEEVSPANATSRLFFGLPNDEFIVFTNKKTFKKEFPSYYKAIAEYEGSKNPAIATWKYGGGRVFYIADLNLSSGFKGQYNLVDWVKNASIPFVYAHCGNITQSSFNKPNLVRLVRIVPFESSMLKMNIYTWSRSKDQ